MLTKCALAAIFVLQVCWAIPYDLTPRIGNGEDATPGEFPYLVSVQRERQPGVGYNHICGGSILNEWYILTARSCANSVRGLRVIAGKYYLKKNETTEQTIKVTKIVHYYEFPDRYVADIALLELKEPLIFNSKVQPIKLPAQGQKQDGEAIISGWGETYVPDHMVLPNKLQKAVVPILSNEECQKELNSINSTRTLYSTMVCSGTAGKNVSICYDDYGSPLAQGHGADAVQVGIVYWRMRACLPDHIPIIYIRVSSYIDWIHRCIDKQTNTPATLTTPATSTTPAEVPEVTIPASSATTVAISFLNKFAITCIAVIPTAVRL